MKIQEDIDLIKKIREEDLVWSCFPGRGIHEIGCPHRNWDKKDYKEAFISKKIGEEFVRQKLENIIPKEYDIFCI